MGLEVPEQLIYYNPHAGYKTTTLLLSLELRVVYLFIDSTCL